MGVQALILWQQRRVDIEHAPIPFCDEFRGQYPHISSQSDIDRTGLDDRVMHDRVMRGAVKADMRHRKGWNAFCRGDF